MTLADHIQHMQPAAGANPARTCIAFVHTDACGGIARRALQVGTTPGIESGGLLHHIHALDLRAQRAESLGLSWAPVLRAQAALLRAALPAVLMRCRRQSESEVMARVKACRDAAQAGRA